ncbi:MAG: pyridoxal-phosphate-dependent aminotransferase family protein [Candidatus Limnocylindrales bacterium]
MSPLPIRLHVPGPTPLPDAVREAGARQMVNHRGPEFEAIFKRVRTGLKRAFRTEHDILLLTCSGTGGLEAAIVNHLSPGDPVLAVSIGSFGDRFAKIATTYGADVTKLAVDWGQAARPADVEAAAREMAAAGRSPRAVLLTHNETSTGVTNPIGELAAAVREAAPDALLLVDAISGLGAVPFETDAWGLDVVVTGSQKSWMVPPGLSMVAVGPRAWAAAQQATMPHFYLDLKAHRDMADNGETPWTPAVGIVFALDVAIGLLEAEGYPAIFARHHACGAAARAGLAALDLKPLAEPEFASDTVTAAWLPEDVAWPVLDEALNERGLVIAGGQGKLGGRILRIGHLGAVTVEDVVIAVSIIEDALGAMGRRNGTRGAAATAALTAADAAAAETAPQTYAAPAPMPAGTTA